MLSLLNTWQAEGCQEEFTLELVHAGSRPVQRSKAYREQEPLSEMHIASFSDIILGHFTPKYEGLVYRTRATVAKMQRCNSVLVFTIMNFCHCGPTALDIYDPFNHIRLIHRCKTRL